MNAVIVAALLLMPGEPVQTSPTLQVPRLEGEPRLDGRLDEPVWQKAGRLGRFSQYSPTDGRPAREKTEVLVWYSASAIYFGIRADEAHGRVHATLADRDHIFADDNVQLLLDPFGEGRQAQLFAVNPFGIQGDGTLVETGRTTMVGFGNTAIGGREAPDLSPDYLFQSQGRLTGSGYEVEIRIPFQSLQFQPSYEQSWRLNVIRQVQHLGTEDTWAPARRASASFLTQSGVLSGLQGLERGAPLVLNPELTSRINGVPVVRGSWGYDLDRPQVGGNVRWGVRRDVTLTGTIKPDFSQVETDADQLISDPRSALYFEEKRPFFLEGNERFTIPNQLIYTRRIVSPVVALKLTGKPLGMGVGLLAALDDPSTIEAAPAVGHPLIAVVRPQRDWGRELRTGLLYSLRTQGSYRNQVLGVDGRYLFGGVYSAQVQLAGSWTRENGREAAAALWYASLERNGRSFGLRASAFAADDFRADLGFLPRVGIVRMFIDPSLTIYGGADRFLQRLTIDAMVDGTWPYRRFVEGGGIQDRKLHLSVNVALRGGWYAGGGYFVESFGYDSSLYAGYRLEISRGNGVVDTLPFLGQPRIPNREFFVQLFTPQFAGFDGNVFFLQGNDENFFEWATAKLTIMNAALNWRPTTKLRLGLTYALHQVKRRSDGSIVNLGRIPRFKIEYQLSRPLFLRLVGQYTAAFTDSLRDDTRTGAPILLVQDGGLVRAVAARSNTIRADLLLSYRPTPGTVIFVGYGSSLEEPEAFRFGRLRRTSDGLFLKVSYALHL